jgi:hypothetical protein
MNEARLSGRLHAGKIVITLTTSIAVYPIGLSAIMLFDMIFERSAGCFRLKSCLFGRLLKSLVFRAGRRAAKQAEVRDGARVNVRHLLIRL